MTRLAAEALLGELLDHYPRGVARTRATPVTWSELERRGYGLRGVDTVALQESGWFHPGLFQEHRRSQLGERLHTWAVTDSTNDRAHAAAHEAAALGAVWVTEEQTAGRGRQGRHWLAARFSSLLFSVLLPVELGESAAPQLLPLALGVGVCESLRRMTGVPVRVRWPNDIMLEDHKLGGMLLEARGAGMKRIVVGIGINLSTPAGHLRQLGLPRATSLKPGGTALGREPLLADLLLRLEERMQDWRAGNLRQILAEWRQHDCLRGRQVRLHTERQQFEGQVIGVDDDGRLELRTDSGALHRFTAAEVHIL